MVAKVWSEHVVDDGLYGRGSRRDVVGRKGQLVVNLVIFKDEALAIWFNIFSWEFGL